MVKKIELLIHRFGDAEVEKMLLKLCSTTSEMKVHKMLNAGTYPVPPELTGKYQGFVTGFIHKTGYSVHNLYDIRVKTEGIFITRAIVCYHFAITLNMLPSQVMAVMKYKYKDDIDLNVGRVETALRQNDIEFLYFWNFYKEYLQSQEPKPDNRANSGRKKGDKVIPLLDRPFKKKEKKVREWGD